MAASLASVYRENLSALAVQKGQLDAAIGRLAWLRLFTVASFLFIFYLGFSNALWFYLLLPVAVIFLFLVKKHGKKIAARALVQQLIHLNEQELKALSFDFSAFEAGERFKDEHHAYSYDLDLFGTGSLFQYLNRCASPLGEERLASDLLAEDQRTEGIMARQAAIKELAPALHWRQQLWATGKCSPVSKETIQHLSDWLREPNWVTAKIQFAIMRWGLPVLTVIPLGLSFFTSDLMLLFLLMFIIQWSALSLFSKRVGKTMFALSRYRESLENYAQLFELFKTQKFTSPLLKHHTQQADNAFAAVRKFSKLVNNLEARMNPIANAFGNGIFAFDLHAMAALEKWRDQHGRHLNQWLTSLAEWDALLSLAHFHYANPSFCFPEFTNDLKMEAKEVGHPLIAGETRVTNHFPVMEAPAVTIITGANMAGKSTWLRAVGVNFVLSQAGAPVCAAHWRGPVARLRSGMRTTDSLQDHQSYFYAELKRLQRITEELRAGHRMVVLLDEILKGTNSDDKQAGSRELILQLIQMQALVLLATHDVALGSMAKEFPAAIQAACFESEIRDGQLFFDYRLRPGVAQTRNATFLLRKMGIVPGVPAP